MKANTAIGFILAGVALWEAAAMRRRSLIRACALVVALIGGLSLVEDLFGLDFGMDQWLFRDELPQDGVSAPGRMSPATAPAWSAHRAAST